MGDHELNSISPDQILPDYSSRDSSSDHVKRRHSRICLLAAVVFVLGVCCLVTGVALIVLSQTQKAATKCNVSANSIDGEGPCNATCSGSKNDTKIGNPCAFSLEAKVAGKPIKCIWETGISNNMSVLCIITRKFYKQMLCKVVRFIYFPSSDFLEINLKLFISAFIQKKRPKKKKEKKDLKCCDLIDVFFRCLLF